MMKRFEGTWHIRPFNQQALDESWGFNSRQGQHWSAGPRNVLQGFHGREALSCVIKSQLPCTSRVQFGQVNECPVGLHINE